MPENTPAQAPKMEAPRHVAKQEAKGSSQGRLRRLLETNVKMVVKKPNVEGREYIPQENNFVVATSHLSDIDVQAVGAELVNDRKIGITSLATNITNPLMGAAMKFAGKENFFKITNIWNKQKNKPEFRFNAADFKQIEQGVNEEDRTMIVAGHEPTRDGVLPDKPGIGPVLAAILSGKRSLLPVALDIHSDKPVGVATASGAILKDLALGKRPTATLKIGEPIELSDIPREAVERMLSLYASETRSEMSGEERQRAREEARQTQGALMKDQIRMMNAIAMLLPPEKRGKWPIDVDAPATQTPDEQL